MSESVGQFGNPERIQIFERYQPLLFSIVHSILENELETQDLLREMLQIWLRAPESEVAEARTFLVTAIAARATILLAAKEPHWVKPCHVVRRSGDRAPGSTAPSSRTEFISKLALKVLDGLPVKERSAFFLRTVFKCKYYEIGQIIGKNEIECRKIVRKVKKHMLRNCSGLSLLDHSELSQN
jgi:RNA polymerase sigma-70 factor (ECF subfamily)